MKTKTDWINNSPSIRNANGDNSSGFSGLPCGLRSDNCFNLKTTGYWWSSTQFDENRALSVILEGKKDDVTITDYGKYKGFSIRCIKD